MAQQTKTDLDTLDDLFVKAFQGLHEALMACARIDLADAEDGVKKIRDRRSLVQACLGADEEVQKFRAAGDEVIREMWRQYSTLTENYVGQNPTGGQSWASSSSGGLRQHQFVPRTLKEVSESVWQQISAALQPISRDITTRMQQNHWKGRGADDYMKQLPMQKNAVTEFGQYVAAATTGVDIPGMLQALVFSAGATELVAVTTRITGNNAPRAPSDQYFTKSSYAARSLRNVNSWWTTKLMTGEGSWKITLDAHVREMTSSQVKNPVVLTGDRWPRATRDTTSMPTPRQDPLVDRLNVPVVSSADPASQQRAIDQRLYQEEDRSRQIW